RGVFHHGEVDRCKTGTAQAVSTDVAEGSRRRLREGCWIDPLLESRAVGSRYDFLVHTGIGIANEVGAVATLKRTAHVPSGKGGVRKSGVQQDQRVELPAADQALGSAGRRGEEIGDVARESVAHVEVGRPAIIPKIEGIGWVATSNRRSIVDRVAERIGE